MAVAVLIYESFNHRKKFLLLASWQSGCGLKDQTHFSHWPSAFSISRIVSKKFFNGNVESLREFKHLVGTKRYLVTFPVGICSLRQAEFFSHLLLAEASLLSEIM